MLLAVTTHSREKAIKKNPQIFLNCKSKINFPLIYSGCGSLHLLRALDGTRILQAAAPTAPSCFCRWQRSSLLQSEAEAIFNRYPLKGKVKIWFTVTSYSHGSRAFRSCFSSFSAPSNLRMR